MFPCWAVAYVRSSSISWAGRAWGSRSCPPGVGRVGFWPHNHLCQAGKEFVPQASVRVREAQKRTRVTGGHLVGAYINLTLIKPLTLEIHSLNNACSAKQAYFFVGVSLPHELLSSLSLGGASFANRVQIPPHLQFRSLGDAHGVSRMSFIPSSGHISSQAHLRDTNVPLRSHFS